jgi:PncC family amidohydrolase
MRAGPVHPLAVALAERLGERHLTLAVAESCTGGLVATMITDQPGSSAYFRGGVVSYADEAKQHLLEVPAALLSAHGAVSSEVAAAMAVGVRKQLQTDLGASVTGIAGPGAEGTRKPVGLTYVGVASPGRTRVLEHRFAGDRWAVRQAAAEALLELLLQEMGEMA